MLSPCLERLVMQTCRDARIQSWGVRACWCWCDVPVCNACNVSVGAVFGAVEHCLSADA